MALADIAKVVSGARIIRSEGRPTLLIEAITELMEYNHRATERVLEFASRLNPDEFTVTLVVGQPAVRDTLVHICASHSVHLSWWDGSLSNADSWRRRFPPQTYPDGKAIRVMAKELDAQTRRFLGTLTRDADLDRVFSYTRADGTLHQRVL